MLSRRLGCQLQNESLVGSAASHRNMKLVANLANSCSLAPSPALPVNGWPSTATISSPFCRPALAAAESGSTALTIALSSRSRLS